MTLRVACCDGAWVERFESGAGNRDFIKKYEKALKKRLKKRVADFGKSAKLSRDE